MKYVLEFGRVGGAHTDNIVVPTRKLAERLARAIAGSYANDATLAGGRAWTLDKHTVRKTWTDHTFFVAVSKLDGEPRGPASARLWKGRDPKHGWGPARVVDRREEGNLNDKEN